MERLRVLHPAEHVYAFYDGRDDGPRFADGPNWVDDGARSAVSFGMARCKTVRSTASSSIARQASANVPHFIGTPGKSARRCAGLLFGITRMVKAMARTTLARPGRCIIN